MSSSELLGPVHELSGSGSGAFRCIHLYGSVHGRSGAGSGRRAVYERSALI